MDYLTYYGLSHEPFDKEHIQGIETIDSKELMTRLSYLKQTRGLGVVTGRSGVGKTYLIRQFLSDLNPILYKVCYIPLTTASISDFYIQLSVGFGLEPLRYRAANFKQIQERIQSLYELERVTPIIVIDEAQYLKREVFHDLMLLTNFRLDSTKPCVVLLSGLPSLTQRLQRAEFEAFAQRLTTRYQVVGMEMKEVMIYITTQLKQAGVHDVLFTEAVIETILSTTGYSLRRLNQALTQCLMIGAVQGQRVITQEIVYAANQEMSFL